MTEHYVDTIETERLILREATLDDTAFVYALYNDPAFKQFVGDRGVHSLMMRRITSAIISSAATAKTARACWLQP